MTTVAPVRSAPVRSEAEKTEPGTVALDNCTLVNLLPVRSLWTVAPVKSAPERSTPAVPLVTVANEQSAPLPG
jgi:hypothetical protein